MYSQWRVYVFSMKGACILNEGLMYLKEGSTYYPCRVHVPQWRVHVFSMKEYMYLNERVPYMDSQWRLHVSQWRVQVSQWRLHVSQWKGTCTLSERVNVLFSMNGKCISVKDTYTLNVRVPGTCILNECTCSLDEGYIYSQWKGTCILNEGYMYLNEGYMYHMKGPRILNERVHVL